MPLTARARVLGAHVLYASLMAVLQWLLPLKLWWRSRREPVYRQQMRQRWGYYLQASDEGVGWVWLHAVSLGETQAAASLVDALRNRWPGVRLLLTHGTATGMTAGRALLRDGDLQVWAPWDASGSVGRFFRQFAPRIGLVMETEVWPNWLRVAQARGIPMYLVNARMSERSMRAALRWPSLSGPAFARWSGVAAQSQDDANRLERLGAHGVAVTGQLKFDFRANALQLTQGRAWRDAVVRPVIALLSSRDGEEAQWLSALNALGTPSVVWLVVPRHPNRFADVVALVQSAGWQVSRRSKWPETGPIVSEKTVLVGDSIGEVSLYCGLASAVVMGGSFGGTGGQNPIEPYACGCHVFYGPSCFNFSAVVMDLAAREVLTEVVDLSEAVRAAEQYVQMSSAHAGHSAADRLDGATAAEVTLDWIDKCEEERHGRH
jgi:3-deoxy-D-manno-octulosonic-acid transferase